MLLFRISSAVAYARALLDAKILASSRPPRRSAHGNLLRRVGKTYRRCGGEARVIVTRQQTRATARRWAKERRSEAKIATRKQRVADRRSRRRAATAKGAV